MNKLPQPTLSAPDGDGRIYVTLAGRAMGYVRPSRGSWVAAPERDGVPLQATRGHADQSAAVVALLDR